MTPIQLLIGLGNPGAEYAQTRHNAGAWLVEQLAAEHRQTLQTQKKFQALCGSMELDNQEYRLLIPTTFMNHSGQAVQAYTHYYRIEPNAILVMHDELDLPVGTARFKFGGGDGGHNGLKDITARLNTNQYWRLRIGIGHPGHRDRVHDYVLSKASQSDRAEIISAIDKALVVLPRFLKGETDRAIEALHKKE